jgi:hypothetical protein
MSGMRFILSFVKYNALTLDVGRFRKPNSATPISIHATEGKQEKVKMRVGRGAAKGKDGPSMSNGGKQTQHGALSNGVSHTLPHTKRVGKIPPHGRERGRIGKTHAKGGKEGYK